MLPVAACDVQGVWGVLCDAPVLRGVRIVKGSRGAACCPGIQGCYLQKTGLFLKITGLLFYVQKIMGLVCNVQKLRCPADGSMMKHVN